MQVNSVAHVRRSHLAALGALAVTLLTPAVYAADVIPEPRQSSYPGTIVVSVDATDVAKRIFRVREVIPVKAGPLTLLYPEWIPGYHGPEGSITLLTGMTFTAAGRPIEWRRNATNVQDDAGNHLQITRTRSARRASCARFVGFAQDDAPPAVA